MGIGRYMREQLSSLLKKLTSRAFIINVYHYLGDMLISTFPLVDQCHTKTISQKQDHSERTLRRNTRPSHPRKRCPQGCSCVYTSNCSCLVFMWRRSWSKRWKSLPQTSQTWPPFTLWVRRCLDRLDDSPNLLPQISHIRGFSPVCVRVCIAKGRVSGD